MCAAISLKGDHRVILLAYYFLKKFLPLHDIHRISAKIYLFHHTLKEMKKVFLFYQVIYDTKGKYHF